MKKCLLLTTIFIVLFMLTACGTVENAVMPENSTIDTIENDTNNTAVENEKINMEDGFVLIKGGSFNMGSPEDEAWRGNDETLHQVTVGDFYMSKYELTQKEYQDIIKNNPSNFKGDNLPVENISWYAAIEYCNALSKNAGLTPVYQIEENNVSWDFSANGYRLPTEAEWEYACRAGTITPFNTENSISAEQANYYGHYPYMIEENYFEQDNLNTKPGIYRENTVEVGSFEPNKLGLYDMHGNVGEWVWDYYAQYDEADNVDPIGPTSGALHIYRGGGWNDFAKNIRSAYRATLDGTKGSFNIGVRLVRGAIQKSGSAKDMGIKKTTTNTDGKILIAYFSWSGNSKGIAEEIQRQTGADLFEITTVKPYSSDYNTVLKEAQQDQNQQARPELKNKVENMEQYDTILLGYPNWWASIPMPIASFLEEYDFSEKTIIPFCSHGGGRFGQSLTAIAKLAPNSTMGEGLSVHYSGGSTLLEDISAWLKENELI